MDDVLSAGGQRCSISAVSATSAIEDEAADDLSVELPELPPEPPGGSLARTTAEDAEREAAHALRLPEVLQAFVRFGTEGGATVAVPSSKLEWALRFAGHLNTDPARVAQAKAQLFPASAYLSQQDFVELEKSYDAMQLRLLEEKFLELSVDGGSHVGAAALSPLLRQMGFVPLPWLVEELLVEVVGDSRARERSMEDCMGIYRTLKSNYGFTPSQFRPLKEVFDHCARVFSDEHQDARMDRKGLWLALRWLQIEGDVHEELRSAFLSEAVPVEEFQPVREAEFYAFVGACRAHEIRRLHQAFGDSDADRSGSISAFELMTVMELMDFSDISGRLVEEAKKRCGLERQTNLIFEDLCRVVYAVKDAHGFLNHEMAEIQNAWKEYRASTEERLSHAELLGALRTLGYQVTARLFWKMADESGLHDQEDISFGEYKWLVTTLRDRKVSASHSSKGRWRQSFNFSLEEQSKFKVVFQRFANCRADIDGQDLATLLDETVLAGQPPGDRPDIRELHALTAQPPATVSFQLALKANRLMQDHIDWCKLIKEFDAIEETGFSPAEVEGFREIFDFFDPEGVGLILHEDIARALWDVAKGERRASKRSVDSVPGGQQRIADGLVAPMPSVMEEIPPVESARLQDWLSTTDEDGSGCHDFAEFLRLMFTVVQKNWCNINRAAAMKASEGRVMVRTRTGLESKPLRATVQGLAKPDSAAAESNDLLVAKKAEELFRRQRASIVKRQLVKPGSPLGLARASTRSSMSATAAAPGTPPGTLFDSKGVSWAPTLAGLSEKECV